MLIFVRMMARLFVRQRAGAWLARANHLTCYVVLPLQPGPGWLAASASGLPLSFVGRFTLTALVTADTENAQSPGRLHGGVAILLPCLIGLHLAGVACHRMVRRDQLPRRMTN